MHRLAQALIAASFGLLMAVPAAAVDRCDPGAWLAPGDAAAAADPLAVIATAARRAVIILGERHDSAADHRWQLYTVAALHGQRRPLVLGFEMFPRAAQPVLDAWVAGELSEQAFLKAVGWEEVWGYPAELYLPLFRFARDNRLAMIALNVDRELVRRVGREGWAAVPAADRAGIGDPAAVDPTYRRWLASVFAHKQAVGSEEAAAEPDDTAIAVVLDDPGFARFVDAQQVWDRAMAEAAAAAHRRPDAPLVVVIAGRGHAEHGWGIPRQLDDLGIGDVGVLLTAPPQEACPVLPGGLADAVFVTVAEPTDRSDGAAPASRPRLGVRIESGGDGIRVLDVLDGSIAASAGLRNGDAIVAVAGRPVTQTGELVAAVQAMAPGTWLPLQVRRDGLVSEFVARFPTGPDGTP